MDKIDKAHEYHIEMRTKENLYNEIESIIRLIHNYDICEISYHEIEGANKEFLEWIDRQTK